MIYATPMREKSDSIEEPKESKLCPFSWRLVSEDENKLIVESRFVKCAIIKTTTKKIPRDISQYAG